MLESGSGCFGKDWGRASRKYNKTVIKLVQALEVGKLLFLSGSGGCERSNAAKLRLKIVGGRLDDQMELGIRDG